MKNKLQEYFPVIRTREEIVDEIRRDQKLLEIYRSWTEEEQKEYLDMCSGVKGIKLLYDSFFKVIMNPDTRPERLNEFLTEILGRKVRILKVLPNESARIAAESSLLVMDLVVQFEDGSLANVEVQKIGYRFPGQRSACYSADLLLRQYKRGREELGKKFDYREIRQVYTIVLFEKSRREFRDFSKEIYIHRFKQKSDTGVELDLLQEYTFICLDIFRDVVQNEGREIKDGLEEWLVCLSEDDPKMILRLIEKNPKFRQVYEEAYQLCLDNERVMEMFSKELEILDRNTVRLMIDDMREEIAAQKAELAKKEEAEREAARTQKAERAKKEEAEREAAREKKRADEAEKENAELRKELEELRKQMHS